jgi:hypothetical protein
VNGATSVLGSVSGVIVALASGFNRLALGGHGRLPGRLPLHAGHPRRRAAELRVSFTGSADCSGRQPSAPSRPAPASRDAAPLLSAYPGPLSDLRASRGSFGLPVAMTVCRSVTSERRMRVSVSQSSQPTAREETSMLYTIAVVLLLLWLWARHVLHDGRLHPHPARACGGKRSPAGHLRSSPGLTHCVDRA